MDLRFTGLLQPRCVLNLSHSTEKLNQIEKGERSIAKVSLRGEPVGIEGQAGDFVGGYFVSFDETQLSEYSVWLRAQGYRGGISSHRAA